MWLDEGQQSGPVVADSYEGEMTFQTGCGRHKIFEWIDGFFQKTAVSMQLAAR